MPVAQAQLPRPALAAIRALEAAGFEAWAVGGWVRDVLLGKPSHDVDIACSALWQESARVLTAAGAHVRETGTAHGTVTAVIDGEPIEVTTYRVEGAYTDHRHPDEVRFVRELDDDLARRDFTVNAMAYHPERGLADPFGGREDLERGLIRAVGVPEERFSEDALRILRAVRFAACLGFAVEDETARAARELASDLALVARERIGQEMARIVDSGRLAAAMRAFPEVICAGLPELAPMRGFEQRSRYHCFDVWEHTVRVVEAAEAVTAGAASERLRWAALLHDMAKPDCFSLGEDGHGHFYGHPSKGAEQVGRLFSALALPQSLAREVAALVRLHDRPVEANPRSVRRTLAALEERCPGRLRVLAPELIDLKRADALGHAPKYRAYASELDVHARIVREELRGSAFGVADLAIGGDELIGMAGREAGPWVGETLRAALDAILAGELANEADELLAFARTRLGL